MRILLAEDDVSQAESLKDWLEMDGYSVDWVFWWLATSMLGPRALWTGNEGAR